MAKKSNVFAEPVEEVSDVMEVEVQPLEVNPDNVHARVKGTWTMFWGQRSYSFEDGVRYSLPRDLYNYLRKYGNIYDTL